MCWMDSGHSIREASLAVLFPRANGTKRGQAIGGMLGLAVHAPVCGGGGWSVLRRGFISVHYPVILARTSLTMGAAIEQSSAIIDSHSGSFGCLS